MDYQRPTNKDDEQPAASAPHTNEIQPRSTPAADETTTQQFENISKGLSSFERSTLRWTRTAVILSLLAAVFVCGQWREMHTGGKDTHDLADAARNQAIWTQSIAAYTQTESNKMQELADHMGTQADRTKDIADQALAQAKAANAMAIQATLANAVAVNVQRAYLSADIVGVTGRNTADTSQIIGRWRNNGITPAIHVVSRNHYYAAVLPIQYGFTYPFDADDSYVTFVEPPRGEGQFSTKGIPSRLFSQDSGGYVYVYGWATYNDVFEKTPVHLTEYCFGIGKVLFPTTLDQRPVISHVDESCPLHSCYDEECKDYKERIAETKNKSKS